MKHRLVPAIVYAVLLAAVATSSPALAGEGLIAGRVVDARTREPLPLANIIVHSRELGAASDLEGRYRIEAVPEGSHEVEVSMLGYADYKVTDVRVVPDRVTTLDVALTPRAIQVQGVSVTAERARRTVAGLLNSQQSSPVVSSGISAEQIARAPDPRASDVLKRVTGLSVVNDKYVFVRGLNERYSSTILNRTNLPSPEPDKRVVPLDIFPSSLFDDVVVAKTALPNMPGEFTGGAILLTTKDFPEAAGGRVAFSGSGNLRSTLSDRLVYSGGGLDFLGFDDGTRAMPRAVRQATRQNLLIERGMFGNGFTEEELEMLGEQFANVWSPRTRAAPPNGGLSLSYGDQSRLGGMPFGWVGALSYKGDYSTREQESTYYYVISGDELIPRHEIDTLRTSSYDVLWGGIFNAGLKPDSRTKLGLRTTYTQSAEDEVTLYYILPNYDHRLDEKGWRLRWVERSLASVALSGEHLPGDAGRRLEWRGAYALANRYEPDTREVIYESDIGQNRYRLADESNSGSRFYSVLTDNTGDAGLDWNLPFTQWSGEPAKFVAGAAGTYKDRGIANRRFRFKPQDFHGVDVTLDPEHIFNPENIRPNGFQIDEDTRPTDNYRAWQALGAGYAMVDMPLARRLRLAGGVRVEYSHQQVRTFDLFNPSAPPVVGTVEGADVLPSVNLTYKLTPAVNLRAAMARSVSRPSFRELSPFDFTDIGGSATIGNPGLKRATINNFDLRAEWYFGTGENLSVAAFYKDFDNPIEEGLENATEITRTWRNAISAYSWRLEVEGRLDFGRFFSPLAGLALGGNVAFIESRVQLDTLVGSPETNKRRPLQGQSPYVVNVGLDYASPRAGLTASLMFNVAGRRITAAGKYRTPDYYEESFPKLDFTFSKTLFGKLQASAGIGNILDSKVRFTQGGRPQTTYRNGRSASLGLAYTL
ncbi:MAG: TonB-dependent receptor [bacterium]